MEREDSTLAKNLNLLQTYRHVVLIPFELLRFYLPDEQIQQILEEIQLFVFAESGQRIGILTLMQELVADPETGTALMRGTIRKIQKRRYLH